MFFITLMICMLYKGSTSTVQHWFIYFLGKKWLDLHSKSQLIMWKYTVDFCFLANLCILFELNTCFFLSKVFLPPGWKDPVIKKSLSESECVKCIFSREVAFILHPFSAALWSESAERDTIPPQQKTETPFSILDRPCVSACELRREKCPLTLKKPTEMEKGQTCTSASHNVSGPTELIRMRQERLGQQLYSRVGVDHTSASLTGWLFGLYFTDTDSGFPQSVRRLRCCSSIQLRPDGLGRAYTCQTTVY